MVILFTELKIKGNTNWWSDNTKDWQQWMVVLPAWIQENGNNMSDNTQAVRLMVWLSSEHRNFISLVIWPSM